MEAPAAAGASSSVTAFFVSAYRKLPQQARVSVSRLLFQYKGFSGSLQGSMQKLHGSAVGGTCHIECELSAGWFNGRRALRRLTSNKQC